jgi:hypothetical protein
MSSMPSALSRAAGAAPSTGAPPRAAKVAAPGGTSGPLPSVIEVPPTPAAESALSPWSGPPQAPQSGCSRIASAQAAAFHRLISSNGDPSLQKSCAPWRSRTAAYYQLRKARHTDEKEPGVTSMRDPGIKPAIASPRRQDC